MNQGRIWCVVHPTVGLPLLLGSVMTISLVVHASVLTHTNWMSNYWQGGSKAKTTASNETSSSLAALQSKSPGFAVSVSPVVGSGSPMETAFVVTVTPTQNVVVGSGDTSAKRPADHLAMAQPISR